MQQFEPIRRDRVLPREGESDEHWHHRMRVANFYKINKTAPATQEPFWMPQWGPMPPSNEWEYNEPPDLGPKTNGAHRGAG